MPASLSHLRKSEPFVDYSRRFSLSNSNMAVSVSEQVVSRAIGYDGGSFSPIRGTLNQPT